jgi:hypothetical protein
VRNPWAKIFVSRFDAIALHHPSTLSGQSRRTHASKAGLLTPSQF